MNQRKNICHLYKYQKVKNMINLSTIKYLLKKIDINNRNEFFLFLLINLFYFLLILLITLLFVDFPIKMISIIEVLLLLFLHNYYIIITKKKDSIAKQKQINDYKQIESYISLLSVLNISMPLPIMREAAVSPDFANILVSIMFEKKPRIIVELGSGVSTLIIGYCIKKLSCGHVWSLDHNKKYSDITIKNLKAHGLEKFSTVIVAPMKSILVDNETYNWYDTKSLSTIKDKIDMLIIDGPPRRYAENVRYPSLPLLYDYLSNDAIIILDDANRKGEKEIVSKWLKQYSHLSYECLNTEKGTVVISLSSR